MDTHSEGRLMHRGRCAAESSDTQSDLGYRERRSLLSNTKRSDISRRSIESLRVTVLHQKRGLIGSRCCSIMAHRRAWLTLPFQFWSLPTSQ